MDDRHRGHDGRGESTRRNEGTHDARHHEQHRPTMPEHSHHPVADRHSRGERLEEHTGHAPAPAEPG